MFSPFPNKSRQQAFSPASSASSPAPGSLAANLSRHSHNAPAAPSNTASQPQQHSRSAPQPAGAKPSASTAATPPSAAVAHNKSNPDKPRPLVDPSLKPNVYVLPLPDTISTTPGWAIQWRKYTYLYPSKPPSPSPRQEANQHDQMQAAEDGDAEHPAKRQRSTDDPEKPDDSEARPRASIADWLRASITADGSVSDPVERAKRVVDGSIAQMRLEDERNHAQRAPSNVGMEEDDLFTSAFQPQSQQSQDVEDGEVPMSNTNAAAPANTSSSISAASSPIVHLHPHNSSVQDDMQHASDSTLAGVSARSTIVYTRQNDNLGRVERELWVFDIDEKRCALDPLPEHFEDLELTQSGTLSYGHLYPALVDKNTGYPITLTAVNTPSSLDLTITDAKIREAYQLFQTAIRTDIAQHIKDHHDIKQVQVRLCQQELIVFPSKDQQRFDNDEGKSTTALSLSPLVSMTWEGLSIRFLERPIPWQLACDSKDLNSIEFIRLLPMSLEVRFKRYIETSQKQSTDAKSADEELAASAKTRFQTEAPDLVRHLSLDKWALVDWHGEDVLWPLQLIVVQSQYPQVRPDQEKTSHQPMQTQSLEQIAQDSGQYVDAVVKDRERLRVQMAEAAIANGKTPMSDGASPAACSPTVKPTPILQSSEVPSPDLQPPRPEAQQPGKGDGNLFSPSNDMDIDFNDLFSGSQQPEKPSSGPAEPSETEQPSAAKAATAQSNNCNFDADQDVEVGGFDDVLTGLTEDDFSFFDMPSISKGQTGSTSLGDTENNIFNIFDPQISLNADNLFGESNAGFFAPSPQPGHTQSTASPNQPSAADHHATPDLNTLLPSSNPHANGQQSGFTPSPEISEATAASPNFSQLFGLSPNAANSPYKTPFTPFSAENPTPPAPAAALTNGLPATIVPTPFSSPSQQYQIDGNRERFAPLIFGAYFSFPIMSPVPQSPDAKPFRRASNRKRKKSLTGRCFLLPCSWKAKAEQKIPKSVYNTRELSSLSRSWRPLDDSDSEMDEDERAPERARMRLSNGAVHGSGHKVGFALSQLDVQLLSLQTVKNGDTTVPFNSGSPSEVSEKSSPALTAPFVDYIGALPVSSSKQVAWRRQGQLHPTFKLAAPCHASLLPLPRPSAKVLRGDSVISIDVRALALWSKLSLQPLSGDKPISMFVLTDQQFAREAQVCSTNLAIAYSAGNLGDVSSLQECWTEGVKRPFDRDILRPLHDKIRASFEQPDQSDRYGVIFVPSDLSCEEFEALRKAFEPSSGARQLHCQPLSFLTSRGFTENMAFEAPITARVTYDRLRLQQGEVSPVTSPTPHTAPQSPAFPALTPQQAMMESLLSGPPATFAPHFTLHPREYSTPSFSQKWPAPALEALERHRFLHLVYEVTADQKQLLLTACDDCGEMQMTDVISLATSQEQERVAKVWLYLHTFLRKSSVEWRVVIGFLDQPKKSVLECWRACLNRVLTESRMACHVSLVLLRATLPAGQSSGFDLVHSTSHYLDLESLHRHEGEGIFFRPGEDLMLSAYLFVHSPHPVTSVADESTSDSIASAYFYPSTGLDKACPDSRPVFSAHILHMSHTNTTLLHRSLEQHLGDMATSLSDLTHLGRARHLSSSMLPLHVERALRICKPGLLRS